MIMLNSRELYEDLGYTPLYFWKKEPFTQWDVDKDQIFDIINGKGYSFNCCEQYMMAMKAQLFGDNEAFEAIMEAKTPREQKAWGRKVKNYRQDTLGS